MGRVLRIKLLKLVSLLIMFSLEMVSELQRDGKGRSSRGQRGVGGCNNTSPSRSNFVIYLCVDCLLSTVM
jgi:hypothetical protein